MNSNMNKKQKTRQNTFAADFNDKEEDFILVDLDVIQDEDEPPLVSLNHFLDDEETIDRLLINNGFDVHVEPEEVRESGALVFDDTNRADDFSGFDHFIVKPIELAEIGEISDLDIHSMADFDQIPEEEDAIDRLLVDGGFDANDKLKEDDRVLKTMGIDHTNRTDEFGVNLDEQYAMTADTDILASEENELGLDKEAADMFWVKEENPETAKQERVISETIHQEDVLESLNNDALITMLRTTRYEQEKIKEQINNYENKVKKATIVTYTSLGFGIVTLLSAVVMGVIVSSVQTKVSKLTDLVSILEEDMSSMTEKNSDMEIDNSDSSIEQLNQKVTRVPELPEEQKRSSSDISENESTADVTKPAAVNLQSRFPVLEKKKPSEATVKKVSTEKKENNAQSVAGWSVNLTAYEDLSYAKNKAEKFIQKGIPVKVITVNMNNTTWYRLRVSGFKDKEKASSYAVKIKETFNLNTVSVSNI
jgi:cell division septation protein DedD